ncbi:MULTISPECIES: hypothetical protein [Dermacoccus]|uniref:Dihydroorotate dehydrogenase electron transfer subunit iron-sulphur cluster binding domain-containing protein n=1 Tax=Dermacoccus profundi TaxID=322602 RepID=A0ABN2CCY5_9MICO|nr:hypothetical protein [Dermacoccus abyssi]
MAIGDEASAIITRRALPLRAVTPTGTFGGTVEVVIDPDADEASAWLAGRRLHDEVSILGPLGRGFPLPSQPVRAVVAGVGASAASLVWLITELRRAGSQVPRVVIGGRDDRHLLGVIEARRLVGDVVIVVPEAGGVTSLEYLVQVALDAALRESDAPVVYAAGDVSALAAMTAASQGRGAVLQGAFDVPMPCGTGLCGACIVPVAGASGDVRSVRCCSEGPVLPGDRVVWHDLLEQR